MVNPHLNDNHKGGINTTYRLDCVHFVSIISDIPLMFTKHLTELWKPLHEGPFVHRPGLSALTSGNFLVEKIIVP